MAFLIQEESSRSTSLEPVWKEDQITARGWTCDWKDFSAVSQQLHSVNHFSLSLSLFLCTVLLLLPVSLRSPGTIAFENILSIELGKIKIALHACSASRHSDDDEEAEEGFWLMCLSLSLSLSLSLYFLFALRSASPVPSPFTG